MADKIDVLLDKVATIESCGAEASEMIQKQNPSTFFPSAAGSSTDKVKSLPVGTQSKLDDTNEDSRPKKQQTGSVESGGPLNKKRSDYLSWKDYFMNLALLSGYRSKDPSTQVGACIVDRNNKIVGIGYNGMPLNCDDELLPWGKYSDDPLENKYLYVCHAELNAILNKNAADLKDCTLYVTLFPCNECAKVIIQSRLAHIYFMDEKNGDKPSIIASKRLLKMAGITFERYSPKSVVLQTN